MSESPLQLTSPEKPTALWVSTSLTTRGGVSSFVRAMRETTLWTNWRIRHIATHRDGTVLARIGVYLWALPRLFVELIARRPAIVHVHMASYGSFYRKSLVVWLCRVFRCQVVLHIHGSEFHRFYDSRPALLRRFVRATCESSAVVIALGATWRERLRSLAPKANVVVVPNSVRPGVPVLQPPVGSPVQVLFLGRVGERKGTFGLIDAWSTVVRNGANACLAIVGDGDITRARAQVDRLGLNSSIDVVGWVPSDEVPRLLARSQVLVLPSRDEGQPMAILEAMARGLCVVATDTGGIPDLIDPASGLLVPVGDQAALASALEQVVTEPDIRMTFGANALRRVREEFDADVIAQRFDEIYLSVLQ